MRSIEIVVAVLVILFGAIIVLGSYRLGARWGEDGPQAGYFPFYIGLLVLGSAIATLVQVLRVEGLGSKSFVSHSQLKLIMVVLVPSIVYVALIGTLGIYVASTLFLALFMRGLGKYSWIKTVPVALGVNIAFFLIFEMWFAVPLPKGPLEAWLGLG